MRGLALKVGGELGERMEATSPRAFVPLCLKCGAVKADEDEPEDQEGRQRRGEESEDGCLGMQRENPQSDGEG